VEWLLDHAPVGRNWCLIHATHMGTRETTDLAATGAVAGLCPVTEANLGDGIFNGADWLAAGGPYGVGTDSNVAISAALELQMLEVSQRLGRRARNVMAGAAERSTGRSLFDTALAGGAAALGAGASGITPGAGADLVALDPDHPSLLRKTNDAILDSWIFGTARPAVDAVWVAGRQYVIGGRHIARDAVAARFGQVMRRLLTS
jgi:formiminoglutamate deiminase